MTDESESVYSYEDDELRTNFDVVTEEENGSLHDTEAYLETLDPEKHQELFRKKANSWRNCKATLKLRSQINVAYPNRDKKSDGTVGDPAHCPGTSDHCPNIIDNGVGVVTAIDITHDPGSGCDIHAIADTILASKDFRIKYIISNGRIGSSYDHGNEPAWKWRNYSGSNPHTKHAHFSVLGTSDKYDSEADWQIAVTNNMATS